MKKANPNYSVHELCSLFQLSESTPIMLKFVHHSAAISTVESYIYFYNYKRLHSSLGYITSVQKMAELKKVA